MRRRRIAAHVIAVAAIFLAGCLDGTPASSEEDDRPRLSDFEGCERDYPDGTPVDCDADVSQTPDFVVPGEWFCVDRFGLSDPFAWIWTDGEGRVAFEFDFRDLAKVSPGDIVLGSAVVENDEAASTYDFRGASGAFAFPDALPGDSAGISFKVDNFRAANGTPPFLDQANLSIPMSKYDGDSWYLWRFTDGAAVYHFSTMYHLTFADESGWTAAGVAAVEGVDFQVDLWSGTSKGTSEFGLYKDPVARLLYQQNPNC